MRKIPQTCSTRKPEFIILTKSEPADQAKLDRMMLDALRILREHGVKPKGKDVRGVK